MTANVYVEVTNTLAVDFLTGFQRHTRETLRHLPGPDATGPIRVVPITWDPLLADHRRLTAAETVRLFAPHEARRSHPAAAPPAATAVARAKAALVRVPGVDRLRVAAARRSAGRASMRERSDLRVAWTSGDVLFDLEAAWEDPAGRPDLLPRLAGRGVLTTALVADLMPVLYPHWFRRGTVERFRPFIEAHLRHSASFAHISECTRRDAETWAQRIGVPHALAGTVVTLGADPPGTGRPTPPRELEGRRYLLCVSTVEPRKNQALVLDVYERLRDRYPDLAVVFVGRQGWHVEELADRLRSHPDAGVRVQWIEGAGDDDLATLYRHAFLALVPSWYEGYGVPLVEAMAAGVPAIGSTGGAVPEAAAGIAELADPGDLDAWVRLVDAHLADPKAQDAARRRVADFEAPTWAGAGATVGAWLGEVVGR